ncbi:MAG: cob(I)yrinic acid a,c-diamide adenosyltransferase [Bacteroidales bacterium]
MDMKGYVQIYTGNGKGKTTAALGLTMRAVGAGKKVFIGQFVKGMKYSEIQTLESRFPEVCVKQYGLRCFIREQPAQEDIDAAQAGLREVRRIVEQGEYDVVILDELNIALYYTLFSVQDVLDIIAHKPEQVELVLTGRYAPQELVDVADLVTEMKEVKHYYTQGVQGRKGIES